MRFILASASPRRADLLRSAGYLFEQRPVVVDERVLAGESATVYVQRLSSEKSRRGWSEAAGVDALVLSADTAVVLDAHILGKPRDEEDAARMLRQLSGRTHQVVTGVSIRYGQEHLSAVETTSVWFAELADDEIAWYVGTGEGQDKAGGYAVQGLASRFIPKIEGSYSNVVGLPVACVHELLKRRRGAFGGFSSVF